VKRTNPKMHFNFCPEKNIALVVSVDAQPKH